MPLGNATWPARGPGSVHASVLLRPRLDADAARRDAGVRLRADLLDPTLRREPPAAGRRRIGSGSRGSRRTTSTCRRPSGRARSARSRHASARRSAFAYRPGLVNVDRRVQAAGRLDGLVPRGRHRRSCVHGRRGRRSSTGEQLMAGAQLSRRERRARGGSARASRARRRPRRPARSRRSARSRACPPLGRPRLRSRSISASRLPSTRARSGRTTAAKMRRSSSEPSSTWTPLRRKICAASWTRSSALGVGREARVCAPARGRRSDAPRDPGAATRSPRSRAASPDAAARAAARARRAPSRSPPRRGRRAAA